MINSMRKNFTIKFLRNLDLKQKVEVGHIFYFGDKYSKPMNSSVDHNGKKEFVKMGSYGVGVSRLVEQLLKQNMMKKKK